MQLETTRICRYILFPSVAISRDVRGLPSEEVNRNNFHLAIGEGFNQAVGSLGIAWSPAPFGYLRPSKRGSSILLGLVAARLQARRRPSLFRVRVSWLRALFPIWHGLAVECSLEQPLHRCWGAASCDGLLGHAVTVLCAACLQKSQLE